MSIGSGEGACPVRYDGYEVYRITPKTAHQLATLKQLEESTDYNFWTGATTMECPVDIMVSPHKKCYLLNLLNSQNMEAEVWIENVQERIDNEKRQVPKISTEYDWQEYQTLDELNAWLSSLVVKFPQIVMSVVGGKSTEGRQIKGVKVSYKMDSRRISFRGGQKKVFLEGGIHARECSASKYGFLCIQFGEYCRISPATVTYILNQLLCNKNPAVRAAIESREWHVFPCVNPDGYVYSHTTDRMWRKNRRRFGKFYGVDLNRNWNYHWMEGHSSLKPSSRNYAGESAFSEIETRTLSRYINNIAASLDVYLAFHSYCQKILSPYSHCGFEKPRNYDEHQIIAKAAAESLASRYGTRFKVGNGAESHYVAGGISVDWVKGCHRNVRLAYTYELRDTGKFGFLLPPEQIRPTGRETFDSIIRIIQELDNEK